MEFDWDAHNEEHVARHAVEPWEAEEAFADRRRVSAPAYQASSGEKRQAFTGKTEDGRLLTVIVTKRGERFRVVTARDASEGERRKYRRLL